MNIRLHTIGSLLAGISLLLSGCGDRPIDTSMAEGTVTFNGQPVEGANVMFSPANEGAGSPAYATTDASGRFVLQTQQGAPGAGTTAGEYTVTISKVQMVGTGRKQTTPEGVEEEIMEPKEVLPRQYKFQSSTPLTATVVEGQPNVFEFNLE
jgi:hypothetical protein